MSSVPALISVQDFLNSKEWCHLIIGSLFKNWDADKDGFVTKDDDVRAWDILLAHYQSRSSPEAVTAFKAATGRQRAHMGDQEKLSELEFLTKMAEIAAEDMKRMFIEGEDPILVKVSMAFFDLLDTNSDGVLSKDEFFEGYRTIAWADEAIEIAYNALDGDGVGTVTRQTMEKVSYDFWYKTNYDSSD